MLTKEKIRELKTENKGTIGNLVREHRNSNSYVLEFFESVKSFTKVQKKFLEKV